MSYAWRFTPVEPAGPVAGTSVPSSFGSQSDAESWVGETWRELAATGVERVVLLRDGTELYAMSLVAG